jgi:hypothetical protein
MVRSLINAKSNRELDEANSQGGSLMSWNDSNFWAALLGGGVISAIISSLVSLLIAFRLGPRHVEKERAKREHSMKLMTGGLIPWRDGRGLLCRVGFQYSPETERFEGMIPEDPKSPVFFDVVKAHLTSGHSGILEIWEDYKLAVLRHNRNVAEFLEGINKQIASSAKLPQYHHLLRQNEPDEYIIPTRMAEEIYNWLRYESDRGKEWNEVPKVGSYIAGEDTWYQLASSGATFGRARTPKKFNSTLSTFDTIRNSAQNKRIVDQFVKTEREVLPIKEKQFEDEINKIIRSIELGNCLTGKCEDCPK